MACKYMINREIASGSFSTTYLCTNENKQVVLKVNNRDYQEFYKEIDALRRINNNYIISLKDVVDKKKFKETINSNGFIASPMNSFSLILERANFDLSHYINNKKTTPDLVNAVTYQMLLALDYLDSIDLMHRDIKSQNILVFEKRIDGRVGYVAKLCDFNNSIYYDKNDLFIKPPTAYYVTPPENAAAISYDKKIDVWCMGSVFYELIFEKEFIKTDTNDDLRAMLYTIVSRYSKAEVSQFNKYGKEKRSSFRQVNESNSSVSWYKEPTLFKKQKIFPESLSKEFQMIVEILKGMLTLSPEQRASPKTSLCSKYFDNLRNLINQELSYNVINCTNSERIENEAGGDLAINNKTFNQSLFSKAESMETKDKEIINITKKFLSDRGLRTRPRILYHAYDIMCRYVLLCPNDNTSTKELFICCINLSSNLFNSRTDVIDTCCKLLGMPSSINKNLVKKSASICIALKYELYNKTPFEKLSDRTTINRMSSALDVFYPLIIKFLLKWIEIKINTKCTIDHLTHLVTSCLDTNEDSRKSKENSKEND